MTNWIDDILVESSLTDFCCIISVHRPRDNKKTQPKQPLSFLCLLIFPIDISQQQISNLCNFLVWALCMNRFPLIVRLPPPTFRPTKQICYSCHLQFMLKLAQINLIMLPQIFGCFLMWKFVVFLLGFSMREKELKTFTYVQWPKSLQHFPSLPPPLFPPRSERKTFNFSSFQQQDGVRGKRNEGSTCFRYFFSSFFLKKKY